MANGNTAVALREMERIFQENQWKQSGFRLETRTFGAVLPCYGCTKKGACVFDDLSTKPLRSLKPVMEWSLAVRFIMPLQMQSWLRFCIGCFYSTPFDKRMKVGASVVAARRGGLSATFDELNKFFTISGMPVASSQYWNSIHGREPAKPNRMQRDCKRCEPLQEI